MDFYKTTMGKRFFEQQLPNLITALKDIAASLKNPPPVFRLEQEATPDFLTDLYYGRHDPLEPANPQVFHKFNADIIAHQDQMRKLLREYSATTNRKGFKRKGRKYGIISAREFRKSKEKACTYRGGGGADV